MTNYRKYYWLIAFIVILIVTLLAIVFKLASSPSEIVSIVDLSFGIIGFIIAILEILMVRSISENSRIAVANAVARINELFSISDLSRGIKTAYDIQKYLRSSGYIVAHIRMQDLKSIIIPLQHDKRLKNLEIAKHLPSILSTLTVDINNLDNFINDKKKGKLNISQINKNLEDLVSMLIEYENHIKVNN